MVPMIHYVDVVIVVHCYSLGVTELSICRPSAPKGMDLLPLWSKNRDAGCTILRYYDMALAVGC